MVYKNFSANSAVTLKLRKIFLTRILEYILYCNIVGIDTEKLQTQPFYHCFEVRHSFL